MRRDLLAAREKNGVYMAQENYEQITREIELQRKEIVEKLEQIKAMEEEQTRKEESCQQLQGLYDEQQTVLHVCGKLTIPPFFPRTFSFQAKLIFD